MLRREESHHLALSRQGANSIHTFPRRHYPRHFLCSMISIPTAQVSEDVGSADPLPRGPVKPLASQNAPGKDYFRVGDRQLSLFRSEGLQGRKKRMPLTRQEV